MQLNIERLDRVFFQPVHHLAGPKLGICRDLKHALVRDAAQKPFVGDAKLQPGGAKRVLVDLIGRDQLQGGVKHGESVIDGVDRIPHPPLSHLRRGGRPLQITDELLVQPLQALRLGDRFFGDLALFDDLIGQGTRMQRQLFIGEKKLAALVVKQTFGGQAPAPFLCQPFCQIHTAITLCRGNAPSRFGFNLRYRNESPVNDAGVVR